MNVSKLGFYGKEGHILMQMSVQGLSEPRQRTKLFSTFNTAAALAESDPFLETTTDLSEPSEKDTPFHSHADAEAHTRLNCSPEKKTTVLCEPYDRIKLLHSFEAAFARANPEHGPERSKFDEELSQAISINLFKSAVRRRLWPVVLTLVQLGVSVKVRDKVFVHPEEWDLFADTVCSGLEQDIPTACKQRIREFAFEKALIAGHEDYLLQLLPERKLKVEVLQQLARRVARGLPTLAVNLMTKMNHSNFTEHVWAQAILERQWGVIDGHVQRMIQDKNIDDRFILMTIHKKRMQIHKTLCTRLGPLRVHGTKSCLVYDGVVMHYMGKVFNELFALGTHLERTSTRLKRDFDALCQRCQNKEFFLDFFDECLKKAVAKDYDLLYGFLLKQLPLTLVDVSKKTSCELVLKSLLSVAGPRKVKYEAYGWLNQLKIDPKYMSELVDIIFENKDWLKLLPVFVKFLSQGTLLLPDFLWLYHKALMRRQGSLTRFVPALNTVLKTVTVGTQTPLVLTLHRLSMAEEIYGQQTSAKVTEWSGLEAAPANSAPDGERKPVLHSWNSTPDHAWTAADKTLIAFAGHWLAGWCRERNYANVTFFLSFLLKHVGCVVDWKVVSDTRGYVSDYLLLEGVSYAALDRSSSSAASMLGRCSWNGAILKACPQTLYQLLIPQNNHALSMLIMSCKYAKLSSWSVFLTYAKLRHDQQWRKSYQLMARLKPVDRVLIEEVCRDAVNKGHWETFVNMARKYNPLMFVWGQRPAHAMSSLLKKAMDAGQVKGAAAALSMINLYNLPNFYEPKELLVAALQSPHPEKMARACIAAGASILHRKMESCRSPNTPCAMTKALVLGKKSLVTLLHESGACSNARLLWLDSVLAANNGRLQNTRIPAECQEIIRSAASNPLPLAKLAGFALSDLIGLHPGRSQRVQGCFGPQISCPEYARDEMFYAKF